MAVITVTNSNDSGTGSLRAALAATAPGDTIAFASSVTSITLDSPLTIDPTVTIDGDYAKTNASVTIDGAVIIQSSGVVTMDNMRIVNSSAGLAATSNAEKGDNGDAGMPGSNGPVSGGPGTQGGDADPGGDATEASGVAFSGTPAIENDGTLTLINSTVAGGATGGKGADGADGGDGGYGGDGGSGVGAGANGANGGIGGDGGLGSRGTDGADAVGGILNTGNLTLEDSVITGIATGGDGGDGGGGGAGEPGGSGGKGGFTVGIGTAPPPGGNGGTGGNGGAAGTGADGGVGGSAVGGILNTGTVAVVGAAVLADDSATGGTGGKGGTPGDVGVGGLAGTGASGGANGLAGKDGNDGTTGVTGADGTATNDILNNGGTESGTLTINGRILELNTDLSGQASTVNISGATPTTFTYEASSLNGTAPDTGTVDWKIVTGTGAPLVRDFTGATSGTLSFSSGTTRSDEAFSIQLSADAAAPRDESFTVELFDPSTGNVIGSLASLTQTVVNLDAPACFAAGTRIHTSRGNIAVEALVVGDLVVTISGALRPIIWLGSREVDCARHGRPASVYPVRIQSGAFGVDLPLRDLMLSPDHAVFVAGSLIPVKHLVNGKTIMLMPVDRITYFHIELETHDVLFAEGLTCETYLDTGDRTSFAENGMVTALHPLWGSEARDIGLLNDALGYAPLRVTGPEVARVRSLLAAQRPVKTRPVSERRTAT
ncbi:Hint domain-containing protein [Acidisoma cladoniae]|jgi:collagen type I/II/III/V/XI/XXIV/XXVII alpha|uniref:Hint domain-containing protein n=1 Tax=Acidisoma cladoniae TaxID=3040935 RepID=UPI0025504F43|nr:Hint domain-containing protein [Acidisoma sp. PAMC 29798]